MVTVAMFGHRIASDSHFLSFLLFCIFTISNMTSIVYNQKIKNVNIKRNTGKISDV